MKILMPSGTHGISSGKETRARTRSERKMAKSVQKTCHNCVCGDVKRHLSPALALTRRQIVIRQQYVARSLATLTRYPSVLRTDIMMNSISNVCMAWSSINHHSMDFPVEHRKMARCESSTGSNVGKVSLTMNSGAARVREQRTEFILNANRIKLRAELIQQYILALQPFLRNITLHSREMRSRL